MYAIIQTGGKQYRVKAGDVLNIEKIPGNNGETVKFDKVLLVSSKDNKVLVGKPFVSSAVTSAEIVDNEFRGDKILTVKYKRRKRYRRTIGHRQDLSRVLITQIEDGQGSTESFDPSKRKEVLMRASISTAELKVPKKASTSKTTSADGASKKKAAAKPASKSTAKSAATTTAKKSSK